MTTYPLAPAAQGNETALNISAATVVKASAGAVVTVAVVTAGSTAGAVYDGIAASGNTTANQVGTIPNTVGSYAISFPCITGIVVAPGTGQLVAVSFT